MIPVHLLSILGFLAFCVTPSLAFTEAIRLSTQFTGPHQRLEIVNGGHPADIVHMRPCGNYSAQLWALVN